MVPTITSPASMVDACSLPLGRRSSARLAHSDRVLTPGKPSGADAAVRQGRRREAGGRATDFVQSPSIPLCARFPMGPLAPLYNSTFRCPCTVIANAAILAQPGPTTFLGPDGRQSPVYGLEGLPCLYSWGSLRRRLRCALLKVPSFTRSNGHREPNQLSGC